MEPTLTAFVSKKNDEKKTYKSGDRVICDYGDKVVTGELRNEWSIYIDGIKHAVLYKDRLQSKDITITPNEPTQTANSTEPTLTAFLSRDSEEEKTYKIGDKIKIKYYYGPEVIGELRNGWSIYNGNGTKYADLDNNSVLRKELIMTPDTSPKVEYRQLTGYNNFDNYSYGGKRSRRRSRKSRKSRKSRR
jgi:hypothetical protein